MCIQDGVFSIQSVQDRSRLLIMFAVYIQIHSRKANTTSPPKGDDLGP